MEKQIKWVSCQSANDENRMLKQHAYENDGEGGNISLCGKMIIGVDWISERFEELNCEGQDKFHCKLCSNKLTPKSKKKDEEN